jgi:hypothetical protein
MSAESHLLTTSRQAHRWVRVVALRAPLRLGAFATLALLTTWRWLSTAGSVNAFRDAHVLGHYESVAAQSLLRFHQLPLWDPYYCGGMYLLGTPQARFVSPTFVLSLLFGEPRGEALTTFVMVVVGLEGTFRYARAQGARSAGALLAAPLFALSGVFAIAPRLGWINFFSFELLPWIAFGTRIALAGRRRGVVVAAVALAWCVGFGGTYAAPMAALWCALELLDAMTTRPSREPRVMILAHAALIAVLALSLSAVRLWPIVETLHEGRRVIGGAPANSWLTVARMMLKGVGDKEDGSFFVGVLAVPAVLIGLFRPRAWRLGVAAALWIWLAAGYGAWPSLFAALRALPLYSTLRYPERFLVLAALAASALAAGGFNVAEKLAADARAGRPLPVPARWALSAPLVVGLALFTAMVPLVAQHWRQASKRDLLAPPGESDGGAFHQARGNRWALAFYEPMNRGSLSCWEAYPVPESPLLQGDLEHEERLVDEGAGTVAPRAWTPNRLDFDVQLTRPARLVVNQNWHSGWRASVGEVRSEDGLLAVDLPAGVSALSMRFEPASARGGAVVTLVAAASLAAIGWSARRRRRGSSGPVRDAIGLGLAAAAPCVAFAVCAACWRDPATAPAVPRAIDGGPVIVDHPAAAATPVGATFAAGVTLEAVTLGNPTPSPNELVLLELDWKRSPEIDRRLGVFVHIEPPTGDALNGDHVLLSSTLDFTDAPADRTLRDVVTISIPDDAAGKAFKIWVGLWYMRGNGKRIAVVDSAHRAVKDNGILAARFVVKAPP